MALSRSVWHIALCASTLMGFGMTSVRAADEVDTPPPYAYQDFRMGIIGSPSPTVRQDDQNWDGDSRGYRFEATYLCGSAPFNDIHGTVYGLRASLGTYDVTSRDDTVGQDLTQVMVDVCYGLHYGIVQTDALRGFAELLPYVGVGFSNMDLVYDGEHKARIGAAYEAGFRAGAYLTEHQWLAGLTVGYVYGMSKISADEEVTLRTNGFQFGGEFGYRF